MKTYLHRFAVSTLVLLLVVAPHPASAESKPSAPLAAVLQPFVDNNELAGAVVLVADKNKILAHESVGWADIAAQRPMTKNTTFWIASMTKPITSVALMILVDEGKISMDDPLTKYLPEFESQMVITSKTKDKIVLQKPKQPILLRHLLSHTSGMAFSSAIEKPTLDMLPLETVVRSYAAEPLLHEPGSKFLYSNEGINTAGRIIEVVTGMSYEEFLQKRLLDPLAMHDTAFIPNADQLQRLATTYEPNKVKDGLQATQTGYLHYPLSDTRRQPMPGGGLFSTAEDVAKFAQMLLNEGELNGKKILSAASVKEMTSLQTPDPEQTGSGYGYGFTVTPDIYGHGGALSTNMSITRSSGLVGIYLVQHQGFPGNGSKSRAVFHQTAMKIFRK